MHYYQFNIKDYSFATIRMSLMEDLAFRRMLDLFYETEKPLPCELKRVSKLIGMIDYQEEVRSILNEFWDETDLGWVNSRAEIEIQKYQTKAESARVNGAKGGRPNKPKITQSVNLANPEITGSKANHKPITNNQELLTNIFNDQFDMFWKGYPRKVNKPAAIKTFRATLKDLKLKKEEVIEFIEFVHKDCTKRFDGRDAKYIPHASSYLNSEGWKDEF